MAFRYFALMMATLAVIAGVGAGTPIWAADMSQSEPQGRTGTFKLQGRAEVQEIQKDMLAWQASQLYRQGAYFMYVKDFSSAADCFKQAGDEFGKSLGEGKFMAESRFAEGQCRRLLSQTGQAVALFQLAADMFKRTDPHNPFYKAARGYLDQLAKSPKPLKGNATTLTAAVTTTEAPPPMKPFQPIRNVFVDENIPLKGQATHLEGTAHKDAEFFAATGKLEDPVTAELGPKFVHDVLYKAFLDMTCLEMAALGGNYYTAPDMYKPFKSEGKPIVIGAGDHGTIPQVTMKLNGREYVVPMNLPGMAQGSKNVLITTDGLHVLALDPKTKDTWNLVPVFTKSGADFSWWKLNHKKEPAVRTAARSSKLPKAVSLFAR